VCKTKADEGKIREYVCHINDFLAKGDGQASGFLLLDMFVGRHGFSKNFIPLKRSGSN
jgi:hypothetical protein